MLLDGVVRVAAVILIQAGAMAEYVPEPAPCASELVVGCYYFPGHFTPMRWTPMREAGFPAPLLGYYRDGEPEVSDWHIKWAVEHGIDFFAFDWYYNAKQGGSNVHNTALDNGFLKARYRDRMQFCLMWCNEGKDERYAEEDMLRLAEVLTERYFAEPNHLRVGGDNVLIISVPQHLVASFGEEGTAQILAKMAEVSRRAGCGGLYPVSKGHADQEALKRSGFRAITAYNYPQAGMSAEQLEANRAPYGDMVRGMEAIWREVTAVGVLPYIVPVSPGWDSRPWYGERALVRTDPHPWLFRDMCLAARQYVDPELRMVIAECWNEFGEGSYVEPTAQYGFGYLDAMREAFCAEASHHEDLVPLSIGRPAPVFDPVPLSPRSYLDSGGNMLYNGDIEGVWGWSTFEGEDARTEDSPHQGAWCLRIPDGRGVKTQWIMPAPDSRKVRITLWYRIPEEGRLSVNAALYRGMQWLGRYQGVAALDGTEGAWREFAMEMTLEDPEADSFNIEFTATGNAAFVDTIDVRPLP